MSLRHRQATFLDAGAVATLHADSWRRHYRGAYSDAYLDGPIEDDRLAVWSARLTGRSSTATILAEIDDQLVGFVHLILDADPFFGALVDNLHVRHDFQQQGLGGGLLAAAAKNLEAARPGSRMYLWVLEQNLRAQAFYRSAGGQEADHKADTTPGGGTIIAIRYVWPTPRNLIDG